MKLESSLFSMNVKIGLLAVLLALQACSSSDTDSESANNVASDAVVVSSTTEFELDPNVPEAGGSSFLVGTTVFGEMYSFASVSPFFLKISEPSDWGSRADYRGPIDLVNNNIVTVLDNSSLAVLDGETGELSWQTSLGGFLFQSSVNKPTAPVCADEICYVMAAGGDVLAIDVENRNTVWSTDLFPNVEEALDLYPLLVTRDRVFAGGFRDSSTFGNVPGRLFVLSRSTGEIENEISPGLASIAGDLLLVSSGGIVAYDFDTLQPVWSYDSAISSAPAVAGDVVVFHTEDPSTTGPVRGQRIVGVNRLDGSILWSRDGGLLQSFFNPTTDGRLIYTAFAVVCNVANCTSGNPMALNPADGSVVWINETAKVEQFGSPVVATTAVFYEQIRSFDFGVGVVGLDSSTGEILLSIAGPTPFFSLTLISEGKAFRSNGIPTFVSDM